MLQRVVWTRPCILVRSVPADMKAANMTQSSLEFIKVTDSLFFMENDTRAYQCAEYIGMITDGRLREGSRRSGMVAAHLIGCKKHGVSTHD